MIYVAAFILVSSSIQFLAIWNEHRKAVKKHKAEMKRKELLDFDERKTFA